MIPTGKQIPMDTKDQIDRYVEQRRPVGGFLGAVLSNDLVGAMGKADDHNRAALFDIVGYCYNGIPSDCWGSPKAVNAWLTHKEPTDDQPN